MAEKSLNRLIVVDLVVVVVAAIWRVSNPALQRMVDDHEAVLNNF